jgi:hypothetical protein
MDKKLNNQTDLKVCPHIVDDRQSMCIDVDRRLVDHVGNQSEIFIFLDIFIHLQFTLFTSVRKLTVVLSI